MWPEYFIAFVTKPPAPKVCPDADTSSSRVLRYFHVLGLLLVAATVWALIFLCPETAFCNNPEQGEKTPSVPNLTQAERDFLDTYTHFKAHVERGYHPFAYVEQETARGFSVDLTDIIARRLGIEVDYVTDQSWEEGVSELKRGELDIVLCMVDTPARRTFAHFTDPFLTTYTGIATRTGTSFGTNLEEFAGHNVGMIKGYWHEDILTRHYPDINIVTFEDHVSALEKLAIGTLDAVLSSNPVLTYHIRQRHMLGLEARPILGSPYFRSTKEGYGVRVDMPLLASAMQKGLDSLSPEILDELRRRWFIDPVTAPNSLKLSVEERRHLEELEELRLCVDPNWMPLEGIDAEGNYTGLGADYVALLQEQLPIPIRVVPTASWMETIGKAQSGTCDLLSMVTPTAQRREYLNFTRPYLHLPIVVATRGEEIFIENIRQMSGRRLGSTRGYATTEEFRRRYPAIDLMETDTVAEGIRKVQSGEIYAFIGTVAAIGEAIRTQGLSDVKISGRVNMTLDLGIGVRKDDPILRDILDRAIAALGPGEGQRLYNRWVTVSYHPGVNIWVVLLSGVGVAFLFAVFIWRNRRLAQLHRELLLAHQQLEEKSRELRHLSITDPL
ncbi:MAG: transporter substrate-binding domain-containing protein, partial [Desulfuromonadaceae bacterium]